MHPGTHTFTVPASVTQLHVACLGGGAGGGHAGPTPTSRVRHLGKRVVVPHLATGGGGGWCCAFDFLGPRLTPFS